MCSLLAFLALLAFWSGRYPRDLYCFGDGTMDKTRRGKGRRGRKVLELGKRVVFLLI
jgi:hypothetical protein